MWWQRIHVRIEEFQKILGGERDVCAVCLPELRDFAADHCLRREFMRA